MDKAEMERIATEERKAYFKAWRAANKDKTEQHRLNFWLKKAMARNTALNSEVQNDTTN